MRIVYDIVTMIADLNKKIILPKVRKRSNPETNRKGG